MTNARKRITILKRANSIFLSLLLLCACDGTRFHSFYPVGGEWERDSVVQFVYGDKYRTSSVYGVRIEARTDASYRYKNLAVCADYLNMCDSLLACDTVVVAIYDDDGYRVGSTAGILYQQQSEIIRPNIFFNDSVVIRIKHLMPDDTLKGVRDIGIRLTDLY